jgi:hypothetical protein
MDGFFFRVRGQEVPRVTCIESRFTVRFFHAGVLFDGCGGGLLL